MVDNTSWKVSFVGGILVHPIFCALYPPSLYLLEGILVLLKAFNLVHFISFGVCGNFYAKGGEIVKYKNNLGRRCSDVFISALEVTGSLLLWSLESHLA